MKRAYFINKDISFARLVNQQISSTNFTKVKEIVSWMGAMQAQDYAMAKWGVGIRLPGSTNQMIEAAITEGEIIRTHLLRPTWHFVSSDDIYWMLNLTASLIKSTMKSRNNELELTPAVFKKSNDVITDALKGRNNLTRDELKKELGKFKINTDKNRLSHLLMEAELDSIICSGRIKNKKQTYALLSERVPIKKTLEKEEAQAELAKRYFLSHSPATLQDFVWWSGLKVKDAKAALESVKSKFISETISSEIYWLKNSFPEAEERPKSIYLLPAYDEFIISYKSKSAAFSAEHYGNFRKAVSANGFFRPFIIVKGQVKGLWNRILKKKNVVIETDFFQKPSQKEIQLIKKKALQFGKFLGMETELKNIED